MARRRLRLTISYKFCAVILSLGLCLSTARAADPPAPVGPIPTARHQRWIDDELTMFIHFGMNTFTGRSTGLGSEDEKLFNPTALDCKQWVKQAKDNGFKGMILTAKHHDGFCLWPTTTTEHSVKNSPWK